MGEMDDLGVSFVRFLIWSADLPMRASWPFANLAFARRWVGVWTWRIAVSTRREGVPTVADYVARRGTAGDIPL